MRHSRSCAFASHHSPSSPSPLSPYRTASCPVTGCCIFVVTVVHRAVGRGEVSVRVRCGCRSRGAFFFCMDVVIRSLVGEGAGLTVDAVLELLDACALVAAADAEGGELARDLFATLDVDEAGVLSPPVVLELLHAVRSVAGGGGGAGNAQGEDEDADEEAAASAALCATYINRLRYDASRARDGGTRPSATRSVQCQTETVPETVPTLSAPGGFAPSSSSGGGGGGGQGTPGSSCPLLPAGTPASLLPALTDPASRPASQKRYSLVTAFTPELASMLCAPGEGAVPPPPPPPPPLAADRQLQEHALYAFTVVNRGRVRFADLSGTDLLPEPLLQKLRAAEVVWRRWRLCRDAVRAACRLVRGGRRYAARADALHASDDDDDDGSGCKGEEKHRRPARVRGRRGQSEPRPPRGITYVPDLELRRAVEGFLSAATEELERGSARGRGRGGGDGGGGSTLRVTPALARHLTGLAAKLRYPQHPGAEVGASSPARGEGAHVAGTPRHCQRRADVRAYGAVADGATDCTEAIQRALLAAAPSHSPLYFPKGHYVFEGSC
eukprot:Rhum_TRINITY_DN14797_c4_g3::Rhum_TRINITY_DN14797_c4_g3_i1::g.117078::m.117078